MPPQPDLVARYSGFRPEVQGLRAVAVMMVVVGIGSFSLLGREFMPTLDEGNERLLVCVFGEFLVGCHNVIFLIFVLVIFFRCST